MAIAIACIGRQHLLVTTVLDPRLKFLRHPAYLLTHPHEHHLAEGMGMEVREARRRERLLKKPF